MNRWLDAIGVCVKGFLCAPCYCDYLSPSSYPYPHHTQYTIHNTDITHTIHHYPTVCCVPYLPTLVCWLIWRRGLTCSCSVHILSPTPLKSPSGNPEHPTHLHLLAPTAPPSTSPSTSPCPPLLLPHPSPPSSTPQVGVPTDKAQYVHRVGRTARAGKAGHALLVLCDFEVSEKGGKGRRLLDRYAMSSAVCGAACRICATLNLHLLATTFPPLPPSHPPTLTPSYPLNLPHKHCSPACLAIQSTHPSAPRIQPCTTCRPAANNPTLPPLLRLPSGHMTFPSVHDLFLALVI